MDFSKFVGKTVSRIELKYNYDGEIGIICVEFDDRDFLEIKNNRLVMIETNEKFENEL